MDRPRLRTVTCTSVAQGGPLTRTGQASCDPDGPGYAPGVLTVVSWFAARKSRKPIVQLVADNLRPFAPLAEKLGDRMHVLVLAEWPQPDRERDGEALLRSLGVTREAWPMLLRDEDDARFAVVLHRGHPVALINLFLRELPRGSGGPEDEQLRAWADEALRKLEELLSRLSPQPPEAGRAPAPQRPPDPGPSRDRFELIELE